MIFLSLLIASAAAGSCPAAMEQIAARAGQGVQAFEDMDSGGFDAAVFDVREQLSCPDRALDSVAAVAVHQLMALDAYMAQEPERVRASFRSVLAVDPDYQPPSQLAPRGNPLRDLFEESKHHQDGIPADLAEPTEGSFYVDGLPATSRPADRPFVLQWISEAGDVRWSDYLPAGAHLPIEVLAAMHEEDPMAVFAAAPPPTVVEPVAPLPEPRNTGSVVLLAGAGGAALASGGLLIAGLSTRSRWQGAVDECVVWQGCEDDPDAAIRDQAVLAERARMLGYAAQGSAGLALGLGIVGGVTLVW
jgi:hypothetical protein